MLAFAAPPTGPARTPTITSSRSIDGRRLLAATCLLLVAIPFLLRPALIPVRVFDADELLHAHAAWSVAHGLVPYRDYWEAHPPALHFLIAPLFAVFDGDRDAAAAARTLSAARFVMWPITGALLAAVFVLARRVAGAGVAWVALLLYSNTPAFLDKSLEIRPDVPAALLLALSTLALLGRHGGEATARSRAASGLLFGLAAVFTPKVVFALPGLAAAMAWPALAGGRWAEGLRRLLPFAAAAAVPGLLLVASFAARGALGEFLHNNVRVTLGWRRGSGPGAMVAAVLRGNPILALAVPAIVAAAVRGLRRRTPAALLFGGAGLGFLAGIVLIPEVHAQYVLLHLPFAVIPLAALLAAAFLRAAGRLAPPARGAVAALILAALSIHPLHEQAARFRQRNTAQLDGIAFVLRNSEPGEAVLDGFSGLGTFRPHALYHFALLGKVRSTWPEGEMERLHRRLRSGELQPRIVIWDPFVRGLSAPISELLERRYGGVGHDPVRVRLFGPPAAGWSDLGVRPLRGPRAPGQPHVVLAGGWAPRDSDEPDGFVRAAAAAAVLQVPVRDPRAFSCIIRARAAAGPGTLALHVNGAAAGTATLDREWTDAAFPLAAAALRPGFNEVRLALVPAGPFDVAWLELREAARPAPPGPGAHGGHTGGHAPEVRPRLASGSAPRALQSRRRVPRIQSNSGIDTLKLPSVIRRGS